MTPNDLIAGGHRMAKHFLHRMVDDLSPAEFRHHPVPGANSAAWVVGHLALTARRTAERLGVTDLPAVPPGLADRLTVTKQPAGDQADLGDPAELVKLFDACTDSLIEAARALPAEALVGPTKAPLASNAGEGLVFLALHVAMHSGQLSTIRRSLGKPPVV
jgi:hypothetical protein